MGSLDASVILSLNDLVSIRILPEGIELRPLEEEHVDVTNSIYEYKSDKSLKLFKKLRAFNTNLGALTADGELVAWCYQ